MIILRPDRNTPGRRDYQGAFRPEGDRFEKVVGPSRIEPGSAIVEIDVSVSKPKRKWRVLAWLKGDEAEVGGKGLVAFFCHGWRTGMQFGFDLGNVGDLAKALAPHANGNLIDVPLYCCTLGGGGIGGDGGFADLLRDALCALGITYARVWGHTTAGHTTRNPHLRLFDGMGSPVGGTGGIWVVAPKNKLWGRWRKTLAKGDLRYRMTSMSVESIHKELVS